MAKTEIDHIFNKTEHRPWPLPNEKWHWQQTWEDLVFIHWDIDESEISADDLLGEQKSVLRPLVILQPVISEEE